MPSPLCQTTGRRKEAVARARCVPAPAPSRSTAAGGGLLPDADPPHDPLRAAAPDQQAEVYDVDCTIHGGGVSSQAGALRMGIARAWCELDPELRSQLKRPASSPGTPARRSPRSTASRRPAKLRSTLQG